MAHYSSNMVLQKTLFYLSGLFPFLLLAARPPIPVFVIYSLFVLLVFLMDLKAIKSKKKAHFNRFYIVFLIVSLFVVETLSWTTNFVACTADPDLLHSQLLWDLLLGIFFYSGLALGWIWAFKYSRFSVIDAFIIQGVFGVLIQGIDKAFYTGVGDLPTSIITWLMIYVIYGSAGGIIFLLTEPPGKNVKIGLVKRYAIGLGCIFVSTILLTLVSNFVFSAFGLPPLEQPICARPFI